MPNDGSAVDTANATSADTSAVKATPAVDSKATPAPAQGADKGTPVTKAPTKADASDDGVSLYDESDADDTFDSKEPPKKTTTVQADWPDDWRERMAGEDDKLLAQLKRRKSPGDIIKSWQAAEQKIRSGEYKKAAPDEDASPEDVAAWRESQGIPKDASGYKLPTVAGYEWNDADKATVGKLQEGLLEAGASQKAFETTMKFYVDIVNEARENRELARIAAKEAHEDARRAEHGALYKPMNNLVNRLLKDPKFISDDVAKVMLDLELPDGTPLKHFKPFSRWLDDQAIGRYGEGGLKTGEEVAAFNNREAELVKMMKDDPDQYNRTGRKELAELRAKKGGSRK